MHDLLCLVRTTPPYQQWIKKNWRPSLLRLFLLDLVSLLSPSLHDTSREFPRYGAFLVRVATATMFCRLGDKRLFRPHCSVGKQGSLRKGITSFDQPCGTERLEWPTHSSVALACTNIPVYQKRKKSLKWPPAFVLEILKVCRFDEFCKNRQGKKCDYCEKRY